MGKPNKNDRDNSRGEAWSDTPLHDPYDSAGSNATESDDKFNDSGSSDDSSFDDEVSTTEFYESYQEQSSSSSSTSSTPYLSSNKEILGRQGGNRDDVTLEEAVTKAKKSPKFPMHVECAVMGVGGLIQGGIAGFGFGAVHHGFFGLLQGRHKFPGFGGEIMGAARQSSGMFALWLGCFFGTNCGLRAIRGQATADFSTNFASGFVAGFISTAKSRNVRIMAVNGLMSGGLVTLMDILGGRTPL